ncbi:gamma-glutamylcyclotransferase [Mesobacillus persicus]|nr:gamma-glutamylcyclotransferase family protein [Mesobacillus persicus]
MNDTYYVFVYGTLRQHESNHHLLKNASCLWRQAWTNGILYDTGYGYPGLLASTTNRVYGEVYEVNGEQLKQLDLLEGYEEDGKNNLYERIIQTIHTDSGPVEAFVYLYLPAHVTELEEIVFGDWKCRRYLNRQEFLYFAYGSCMDDERFKLAGVHEQFARVKGCGVASNFSLAYSRKFHDGGRADMVEESTEMVEGKVYQIERKTLDYLFKREGVHSQIYRPAFIDVMIDGISYKNVLTFLVIDKEEEVAPPEHYYTEILRGAKGLVSKDYYQKLQDDLEQKFRIQLKVGEEG